MNYQKFTAHNAGKPWTTAQEEQLRDYACAGFNLYHMASYLGRTGTSIICRLKKLGLASERQGYYTCREAIFCSQQEVERVDEAAQLKSDPSPEEIRNEAAPTKQENTMDTIQVDSSKVFTTVNILDDTGETTRNYIYGRDASAMPDDEIFGIIGKLENKIDRLQIIRHKPEKMKQAIARLELEIETLANYVDNRGE